MLWCPAHRPKALVPLNWPGIIVRQVSQHHRCPLILETRENDYLHSRAWTIAIDGFAAQQRRRPLRAARLRSWLQDCESPMPCEMLPPGEQCHNKPNARAQEAGNIFREEPCIGSRFAQRKKLLLSPFRPESPRK